MTPTSVKVQIVPESHPSTPSWFGEVAIVAHVLTQFQLLEAITERVRFARARFGTYDVIDFVVVLLGYAISGERTLASFYERLWPFASVFMALFGRESLPSSSALSRFLAALDEPAVEALRTLFQEDLLARLPSGFSPGGLWDRQGKRWLVSDVDGTRAVARQRSLPHTPELPPAHRRMDVVCAPGYGGRKRGEVLRTRTTVLQAHTHQWLGSFGNAGNGDYRGELLHAIQAIKSYAKGLSLPLSAFLLRLDGLYGNAAPLIDILLAGLGFIVRGKDYGLLNCPAVQARLALPPDALSTHPESGTSRALFDCLEVPLSPAGPRVRMLVATHPATTKAAPIGKTRDGLVYEIFLTTLPPQAFTPVDVLHLYLHRGSFEPVLSDEDREQDPDRWVSRTPHGQECWQILSQWLWNLRLELGEQLNPVAMRLTAFAPAQEVSSAPRVPPGPEVSSLPTAPPSQATSPASYGPPQFARPSYTGGFPGSAFTVQPDGTLRCPADQPLYPNERRLERNGSLRLVYAARLGSCRPCPLREQCQGRNLGTVKARRVSAICQPLSSSPSPSVEPAPALVEADPQPVESVPVATPLPPPLLELAPALVEAEDSIVALLQAQAESFASSLEPPSVSYGPPQFARLSYMGGFAGSAFTVQPDGTLRCPANQPLYPNERRLERNGSLRLVYAARLGSCRACPLREQCQGANQHTVRARRVSAVCQPLSASSAVTGEPAPDRTETEADARERELAASECPSSPVESTPSGMEVGSTATRSALAANECPPSSVESASPPVKTGGVAVVPVPEPEEARSALLESVPPQVEADATAPKSADLLTPCPVLWEDWPRSLIRRRWLQLLRTETVLLTRGAEDPQKLTEGAEPSVLTRAQRAHWRLSWSERLARNARRSSASSLSITLHGLPTSFAAAFAIPIADAA